MEFLCVTCYEFINKERVENEIAQITLNTINYLVALSLNPFGKCFQDSRWLLNSLITAIRCVQSPSILGYNGTLQILYNFNGHVLRLAKGYRL